MSDQPKFANSRYLLMGGVGLMLLIFLLWIEGAFVSKTGPGTQPETEESRTPSLTVTRQDADGLISWPARIEPLKTIQIAAKYPGRIMEVLVAPGSPVSRGQVLVRLDNAEMNARLSQAKAHLASAEASASRARADAMRTRNLFAREAVTHQTLDAANTVDREAQAGVQEAKAAVREMESQIAETGLLAPFDGVIERKLQEPGDLVLPGQAILTFLQAPILRIEASLPASCATDLMIGSSIKARMPDKPEALAAIIEEMEPAKDRETQTQFIKARLGPESHVIPGSFVWLEKACGTESLMLIPANAVRHIGQLETVSILKEGRKRIRHIRTGRRFGDSLEILSGLNDGDQITISTP